MDYLSRNSGNQHLQGKSTEKFIVTPGKMLSPLALSQSIKESKRISSYLEESRPMKKVFKPMVAKFNDNQKPRAPILIKMIDFSSFNSPRHQSLQKNSSKLHRSCRLKLDLDTKNQTEAGIIPQLSYRSYEKTHLPKMKSKVSIKTFSPREFSGPKPEHPVLNTDPTNEPTSGPISLPARVRVTKPSKEYGSKLHRIIEILNSVKQEHFTII